MYAWWPIIMSQQVKHRARVRFSSFSMASFNLILLNNHKHGDQNQEEKNQYLYWLVDKKKRDLLIIYAHY